jgi:hypothetical protein
LSMLLLPEAEAAAALRVAMKPFATRLNLRCTCPAGIDLAQRARLARGRVALSTLASSRRQRSR